MSFEVALSDTLAEEARRLCEDGYALLEAGSIGDAEAALVHFRLALVFVDSGRAADAVAALDASLHLQPDNARAHNNRGSALQLVGRHGDAERAFRRALALDPDLAQPYANLGHLLEKQGRARDAPAAAYDVAFAAHVFI